MRDVPKNRSAGFTLVEALAAGTILALSVALLGGSLNQAHRMMQTSRDDQRASQLLDLTLTKIDLLGPARLEREGPTEGSFRGLDGRFLWEAQIAPRSEGHLYEVTARIRWMTAGGERVVEAQTFLNDPPGSRNAALDWESL